MLSPRRLLIFIPVLIFLVAIIVYIFTHIQPQINSPFIFTPSPTPTPTPDPNRPFSVLLLGYGGGLHDGALLTDSIIVARIEPKLQKVTLISLPRDLWVPLPIAVGETKFFKINAAFAIGHDNHQYPNKAPQFSDSLGGGQMAKYIAARVVGFDIDYFIALDFQGFIKVIDNLGGVSVNVTRSFDDPNYPIDSEVANTCGKTDDEIKAITATLSGSKLEEQFTCRYEPLHFDKGPQIMDGATALKYARSRHSPTDGGDFNRAARQRNLINAVKSKVISINFIPQIIPTINTLKSHLQTDIGIALIEKNITRVVEFSRYQIVSLALTDQNVLVNTKTADGQMVLMPKTGQGDYSQIHQFILDPTVLTPTPAPKQP